MCLWTHSGRRKRTEKKEKTNAMPSNPMKKNIEDFFFSYLKLDEHLFSED